MPRRVLTRLAALVSALALAGGAFVAVPAIFRKEAVPWAPVGAEVRRVRLLDTLGFVAQRNDRDCGVGAVAMVLRQLGVPVSYDTLARSTTLTPRGLSMQALADLARRHGVELRGYLFTTLAPPVSGRPWIARMGHGWLGHYVVVQRVTSGEVVLLDPRLGRVSYGRPLFSRLWSGYALVPTVSGRPR